ncbi:DedA family protein [Pseudonocardia sp. MCCB 268]|nr:DedA family protein [Pseudonocardia cytotoxica]
MLIFTGDQLRMQAILPLGGFRASTGADPVAVWAATTMGAVAGTLLLYALGAGSGTTGCTRSPAGWFVLSARRTWRRGHELFDRYGSWIRARRARCLPVVRNLISIPAGIAGISLARFTVLSAVGSGSGTLFVWLRVHPGERWATVETYVSPVAKGRARARDRGGEVRAVTRKLRQRRAATTCRKGPGADGRGPAETGAASRTPRAEGSHHGAVPVCYRPVVAALGAVRT